MLPKYILLSNPAWEDARINRISKNHFILKKKNYSFHIILFLLNYVVCVRSDIKWVLSLDKSLCPTGCSFAYLVLRKNIKQLKQNYSKHLDPSKHRGPNDYRTSPEKMDQLYFRNLQISKHTSLFQMTRELSIHLVYQEDFNIKQNFVFNPRPVVCLKKKKK